MCASLSASLKAEYRSSVFVADRKWEGQTVKVEAACFRIFTVVQHHTAIVLLDSIDLEVEGQVPKVIEGQLQEPTGTIDLLAPVGPAALFLMIGEIELTALRGAIRSPILSAIEV